MTAPKRRTRSGSTRATSSSGTAQTPATARERTTARATAGSAAKRRTPRAAAGSDAKRRSPRAVDRLAAYGTVEVAESNRQDIRLAVVLNGGVSLAVWISGVTVELHRLVQASRSTGDRAADPYAALLDVLDATARIDVIAGTSAGGLNGGFLSLGLVHGRDLMGMRELWRDQGDLSALLRDPREADAPSLLRGEYFLQQLRTAYDKVQATPSRAPAPKNPDGTPREPVELYLTGTLWTGRGTPFADDMGRRIVEVDYDATFLFSSDPELVGTGTRHGNLEHRDVAAQLAVASRATASFPGAFEPVEVKGAGAGFDDRWGSSAGLANFRGTRYVVDGGVLLNKPIRPAMDAVYRQSAGPQVRRLLAYVVPDPGEGDLPEVPTDAGPLPRAHEVVLGVLTRLRSTDSVAAELAEVERRNDDTRQRRRARDRLAQALLLAATPSTPGTSVDLVEAAFPAYLEVRRETAAQSISRYLRRGDHTSWSRRELATALRGLGAVMPFVPSGSLTDALATSGKDWRWGQSAVNRLGDITLDVLRRAVWLAPQDSPERVEVVRARRELHGVLRQIRDDRRSLDASWVEVARGLPPRSDDVVADPASVEELSATLAASLDSWEGKTPDDKDRRRATLHDLARSLAAALLRASDALHAVAAQESVDVDPSGEELRRFRDLVQVLLTSGSSPEAVLRCMLRMEVLHVAFAGVSPEPEQEVELVQVSTLKPELVTGIQAHHFGAFYRASWRVNDWMRGRLDGSAQLVQMLLAPERLRQRGFDDVEALRLLRDVAVGPEGGPRHGELAQAWEDARPLLEAEVRPLGGKGPLPRTFPLVAERIAARLHAEVLEEELPQLAQAVELEPDPLPVSSNWVRSARAAFAERTRVPLRRLAEVEEGSRQIGEQLIDHEVTGGTDTFARTASHGAATFSSLLTGFRRQKLAASALSAVRGYALLVWLLVQHLTSRSWWGTHVVALAVGVGGALVALGLIVPGVPPGVPLVGVVLVLAAATASAMSGRTAVPGPPWARVGAALLIVLVAVFGYLLSSADREDGWDGALSEVWGTVAGGVGKALVVLAVVLLGWWLAGARPPSLDGAPERPTRRRLVWLLVLLLAVLGVGALMVPDGRTMQEQVGPGGVTYSIIDFEVAGPDAAQDVLETWGEEGRDAARRQITVDFGWLVLYAALLGAAARLLGDWAGHRWRRAGFVAACLAVGAGALDALENAALLGVLDGGGALAARTAQVAAYAKFTLLGAVVLFLVAALGAVVVRSVRRDAPAGAQVG